MKGRFAWRGLEGLREAHPIAKPGVEGPRGCLVATRVQVASGAWAGLGLIAVGGAERERASVCQCL